MSLEIGGRKIGEGQPLFVIAELGLNHGGSLDRALAMVDAAADAGASAIKLQTLAGERLVSASAPPPVHVANRHGSLVEFFDDFALDEQAHRAIVVRARERGLGVVSTPLYEEAVDLLESIGIDAYKIASGDLTWPSLIERVARTHKPVILSTGMSTLDEVGQAVAHALTAGARDLALLHCVSSYPVPAGSENLRAIRTLADQFGLPVGLSDHGCDPIAAAVAVALGGVLYEKHLVLPGDNAAVDAAVSATPAQLGEIIATAERVRRSLGNGIKACLPVEEPNRLPSRRSLRAARDLAPNHVIGPEDIVALRPGDGLEPAHWADLVGTVLRRRLGRHEPFLAEDVHEAARQVSHAD